MLGRAERRGTVITVQRWRFAAAPFNCEILFSEVINRKYSSGLPLLLSANPKTKSPKDKFFVSGNMLVYD